MTTTADPFGEKRQPLHAYLRDHARATPDKTALHWYGRAIRYAELDRASDAFAAHLQSLGVQVAEPVALFLNNCPQYIVAHFAIQKIGAVVCPCGPLNKAHELAYQLGDLGARVIVAARDLLPLIDEVQAQTCIAHICVVHYADWLPAQPTVDLPTELRLARDQLRDVPEGCDDFFEIMQRDQRPSPADVGMDDVVLMTYTSGTTGLPKGAMLSCDNALYKTAAAVHCNGLAASDVLLAVAPLYHIAGMLMGINVTVFSGATTVLLHRFDPVAVLQSLSQFHVSWWYSIAPMNLAVMAQRDAATYDLRALRVNPVTSFGVQLTEELAGRWHQLAPNCRSFEAAYGLSETHTVDTAMPADAVRWGTQGRAVPGNDIRIVDPDTGAERPVGESGEIIVRGRGNFQGYWKQPEATARTLREGWVWTGDLGRLDADGYLSFLGRFKEMIKVSGYSVFPEEVEAILIKHPDVAQVAVVGLPDAEKGEVVQAHVVLKPDRRLDGAALMDWARANMAPYKAPRAVVFRAALPATGAGKVLRRLLKETLP